MIMKNKFTIDEVYNKKLEINLIMNIFRILKSSKILVQKLYCLIVKT